MKMKSLKYLLCALLSAALLSAGWLEATGLSLLAALVPLLYVSACHDATRRGWWQTFGWSALTFVLWNAATIWGVWYATPVGPIAATIVSSTLNLIAFMTFHSVSKHASKVLAYTMLVSVWIATEYWYIVNDISFPWLVLGNGFANDVALVQWYEYTGAFGGALWVLLSNIFIFEALMHRRVVWRWVVAAAVVVVPICISVIIYFTYQEQSVRSQIVTLVQPNINCYDKFATDFEVQKQNLLSLAAESPDDVDVIVMPETAIGGYVWEEQINDNQYVREFTDSVRSMRPGGEIVVGAMTGRTYDESNRSETARKRDGYYYDIYNTALQIDSLGVKDLHHKSRLVIGVEQTPIPWLFKMLEFLVVDLGGTTGQLGVDSRRAVFHNQKGAYAPVICYESIYGGYVAEFVKRGAQMLVVITNDGWWSDSPIHRQHFSFSRLRAIENRRWVARSANTGISGFISSRGDVMPQKLGWEERGTLTMAVPMLSEQTFYSRYGDYIGRLSVLLAALGAIYYVVYRFKQRHYLLK